MAPQSPINKMVDKAKSTLNSAKNFTSSVEGKPTGSFAPKIAPIAPPKVTAPQPKKVQSAPSMWGSGTMDIIKNGGKLPTMHKGGVVPGKSGEEKVVKLEAGEKVTPAKKDKKMAKSESAESKPLSIKDVLSKDKSAKSAGEKKGKKSRVKHTHMEHHADNSVTVRHNVEGGGDEESYSRPDLASALQAVQQRVGGGGQEQEPQQEEAPEQAPPAAGGAPQE